MLDIEHPQNDGSANPYHRLLNEIRTGTLQPGDRLVETELAARFGISRTPVREAIRQLEADGLVVHTPRIGAAIRSLGYAEVMELYEMRAVLEGTAARMAAKAASDVEIAALRELNSDMNSARNDGQQAYELNRLFHRALLDAAKNRFLVKAMSTLQKTLLILGPTTLQETLRASDAVAEHEAILDALESGDRTTAEASMRAHIEAAHRVRLRQLQHREQPSSSDSADRSQ